MAQGEQDYLDGRERPVSGAKQTPASGKYWPVLALQQIPINALSGKSWDIAPRISNYFSEFGRFRSYKGMTKANIG